MEGIERAGWLESSILLMETVGADCLNKSLQAGINVTNNFLLGKFSARVKKLGRFANEN